MYPKDCTTLRGNLSCAVQPKPLSRSTKLWLETLDGDDVGSRHREQQAVISSAFLHGNDTTLPGRCFHDFGSPLPYRHRRSLQTVDTTNCRSSAEAFLAAYKTAVDRFGGGGATFGVRYEAELMFNELRFDAADSRFQRRVHFNHERLYRETNRLKVHPDRTTLTMAPKQPKMQEKKLPAPGEHETDVDVWLSVLQRGPVQARGGVYATCWLSTSRVRHAVGSSATALATIEARTAVLRPDSSFANAFNETAACLQLKLCYWNMSIDYKEQTYELRVTLYRDLRDEEAVAEIENAIDGRVNMRISCVQPIAQQHFADIFNALHHYYRFMVETDDGIVTPTMTADQLAMFQAAPCRVTVEQKRALGSLRVNFWSEVPDCESDEMSQLIKAAAFSAYAAAHNRVVRIRESLATVTVPSDVAEGIDYWPLSDAPSLRDSDLTDDDRRIIVNGGGGDDHNNSSNNDEDSGCHVWSYCRSPASSSSITVSSDPGRRRDRPVARVAPVPRTPSPEQQQQQQQQPPRHRGRRSRSPTPSYSPVRSSERSPSPISVRSSVSPQPRRLDYDDDVAEFDNHSFRHHMDNDDDEDDHLLDRRYEADMNLDVDGVNDNDEEDEDEDEFRPRSPIIASSSRRRPMREVADLYRRAIMWSMRLPVRRLRRMSTRGLESLLNDATTLMDQVTDAAPMYAGHGIRDMDDDGESRPMFRRIDDCVYEDFDYADGGEDDEEYDGPRLTDVVGSLREAQSHIELELNRRQRE